MGFTKFLILTLQILQILGFILSTFFLRRWYREKSSLDLKRATGWAFNTSCFSFLLALLLAIAGNSNSELLFAGLIQIMVLPSFLVALSKEKS